MVGCALSVRGRCESVKMRGFRGAWMVDRVCVCVVCSQQQLLVVLARGAVTLFFLALLTKSIVVGERGRLIGSDQSVSQSSLRVAPEQSSSNRIDPKQSNEPRGTDDVSKPVPSPRVRVGTLLPFFFFFLLFFFVSLFFVTCRPWAWMTPALLATLPPPLLALLAARSDQPIAEPRVREAPD